MAGVGARILEGGGVGNGQDITENPSQPNEVKWKPILSTQVTPFFLPFLTDLLRGPGPKRPAGCRMLQTQYGALWWSSPVSSKGGSSHQG